MFDNGFTLQMLFSAIGVPILESAFRKVLDSKNDASRLAQEVASNRSFKDADKEKLVTDERYFENTFVKVRNEIAGSIASLDRLLQDPNNIRRMQSYILSHPLLPRRANKDNRERRQNYLILGHERAGKTCLIQRLLHNLAQSASMGVFCSETEPRDIVDRAERFQLYDHYRRKLAQENENMDRGVFPPGTPNETPIYIDMDLYDIDWKVKLRFFDYAGKDINEITDLHQLVGDVDLDGILVVIDTYRLVAGDLREAAFHKDLLDRSNHEATYKEIISRERAQISDITDGLILRLQFLIDEEPNLPLAFALTKFDGFEHFSRTPAQVKQIIYQRLRNSLLRVVKMGKHPLAIALTSAFGESKLARESSGELIIEDKFTALPALLPSGQMQGDGTSTLPLLFLVKAHMQNRIDSARNKLKERKEKLGLFERIRFKDNLAALFRSLNEEGQRWSIVRQHDGRFLEIEPRAHDNIKKLERFFTRESASI